MKNQLSITKFIETLGCRLRIGWYWSAKSEDNTRVIFTIWSDQLIDGRYLLWPDVDPMPAWTKLPGAFEWRDHIELACRDNVEILGVLCHVVDPKVEPRKRDYYDETSLLVLKIEEKNGSITGVVIGEVDVEAARNGLISKHVSPHKSALDDLFDNIPEGVQNPETVNLNTQMFRRDQMVRNYVLKRANGFCEYCGAAGFLMADGRNYLEAHHILALSCKGPDKVSNVIALCPNHHREAHFGHAKEELNAEMLAYLTIKTT